MKPVLVIGGGPAGLAAAIGAAERGGPVTVLERNDRCGIKLLATGGGHANVSNRRPFSEWPALFGKRGRFILPALERLPLESLARWFESLGVPLACTDGFHLFPESGSARQVRDALVARAAGLGVVFRTGFRAAKLRLDGGRVAGVESDRETIEGSSVILATGGRSLPASGSTGDGWLLAESAGHKTTRAFPGLVGLRTSSLPPDLAGLVLPDAAVFFKARGRRTLAGKRELLLTHSGISGPAVLDLSASMAEALADANPPQSTLFLRWRANMDAAAWREQLEQWRKNRGGIPLPGLIRDHLPHRLARWLCRAAGAGDCPAAALRNEHRDKLLEYLAGFPALVTATEGWDKAMITRGGVALSQVNPVTLESKLVPGLHFAGEVLDLDGPCGGYNLHWSFASGLLAGVHA